MLRFAPLALCLAGCTAMGPAPAPSGAPAAAAELPPDPGTITCAQIAGATDGTYIDAATVWGMGQVRAAILSGAYAGTGPDGAYDEGIATFVSNACRDDAAPATVAEVMSDYIDRFG